MEIWKPIEELPGYSISNKGRVRKDSNGQIMVLSKKWWLLQNYHYKAHS